MYGGTCQESPHIMAEIPRRMRDFYFFSAFEAGVAVHAVLAQRDEHAGTPIKTIL